MKTHLKIYSKPLILLVSIIFFLFVTSCADSGNSTSEEVENNIEESEILMTDNYETRTSINRKREIVFTYITSSGCDICSMEENINAVIQIKNKLKTKTDSLDYGFLAMGVVVDWDVNQGLGHINKFGEFDEILIGNNWFGTGGLKYIFEDIPGRPGVPQVVLTKRVYDVDEADDGTVRNFRGVESEVQIVRHIGVNRLESWLNDGLLIPGY